MEKRKRQRDGEQTDIKNGKEKEIERLGADRYKEWKRERDREMELRGHVIRT